MAEGTDIEGVQVGNWSVRRPVLGVAIAFILGTILASHFPLHPVVGFTISILALGCAFATTWRRDEGRNRLADRLWTAFRCATLLAAVALVGWAAAELAPSDGFRLSGASVEEMADGRRVTVTGIVAGDPETPVMKRGSVWTFPLQVESVSEGSATHPGQGILRVRLTAFQGAMAPAYGDRLSLEGRLSSRPAQNPEWRVVLWTRQSDSRRLSSGHGSRLKSWCYKMRWRAGEMLSAGIADRPETAGVLRALMLGYRSDLDPEMHALFVATGTLHIFAISGSHIVILAALVVVLLRAVRVPRMWWGWAIVPLLAGFTLAIGAEASAVRACVMGCVYWMAPLFGRRPDTLSALAFSALLILGFDPGQITDAGFVLSFAAVLGLIIFYPLFDDRLRPLWEADPLRIQPERPIVVALRYAGRQVTGVVSLTIVAWLVTTPLSACWFGRFTFAALPSNLVIVPMSAVIMLSGCLSLILGQVWTGFAEIFNNASLGLLEVMLRLLRWLRHIPAGNLEVAPWSAWMVAAWYAVLVCWPWLEWVKQDRQVAAGRCTMPVNSQTHAEVP